jgi:hypothetical protein
MKRIFTGLAALLPGILISGQAVSLPNSSIKSHPTLTVNSIEASATQTAIYLQVENKREGGTFCADRNIYIRYPDGTRVKALRSEGIPVCPDTHRFRSVGEKLNFIIYFPPLRKDIRWFDLIEDCTDNCFWFLGLVSDNSINTSLNALFEKASEQKPEDNINLFRKYLEETDSQNLGTEGLIYINIITSSIEAGDNPGAALWYNRLVKSDAHAVKEHVKFLNDSGIRY